MYIGFVNCSDNKRLSEKIIGSFKNFLWDKKDYPLSFKAATEYVISLELLNCPMNEKDSNKMGYITHAIF